MNDPLPGLATEQGEDLVGLHLSPDSYANNLNASLSKGNIP